MIEQLFEKLKSWSEVKVLDTLELALPDLPLRSRYLTEYTENGLVIYTEDNLRYYDNNGESWAISLKHDPTSYEAYTQLYSSNSIRMAEPINRIIIDEYEVLKFKNPENNCGTPFTARLITANMDIDFWSDYITNVKSLTDSLVKFGYKYPSIPINPHKYVTDSRGLFFNPMVLGSEYITFTSDEETFYDIQYKQLAYLTFAYDEGLHYDYIKTLDWDKIRRIARETWFV